jgi:hypothetical protein
LDLHSVEQFVKRGGVWGAFNSTDPLSHLG